jgi:hypothetical protein
MRRNALSKDGRRRVHGIFLKKVTSGHAQFVAGFRNEDEIASSNFEEQVEEICLAESGGPGLGSVRQSLFVLEPISQIGNGCVARDLALQEGQYPSWIFDRRATPLQRQRLATRRAKRWRPAGGVAPQSQNAAAMLRRRALPAGRQRLAHSFPTCEMGSN